MKKPKVGTQPTKPEDTLPVVSVLFRKHPRYVAFRTDRWYDDGSPRLPGVAWFDSDLAACKVLLKEPSLKLCARIRAATEDDLFAAIETFLGLDSPPWEPDAYAMKQDEEKIKKKKVA